MGKILRPMLAATVENIEDLCYPIYATCKLDGIRCCVVEGVALSRNFKPIPNKHISEMIAACPSGFDGEIIAGKNFQETTHNVMSEDGEPEFVYNVFDWLYNDPSEGYLQRMNRLKKEDVPAFVKKIIPIKIDNEKEFFTFEKTCLKAGYEGVCVRSADSPYKFGRSSLKEGFLLKWKRFSSEEAIILECVEQMENTNPKTKDAFGHSKRSSEKDGLVPKDTLGAFRVQDIKSGVEFFVGSGMDDELRKEVWKHRKKYIRKIISYTSQKHGEKDLPRFPVWRGFRDTRDMGE